MLLERGALLNNRYRIVEILGQGGMGSVYKAIDENLGVEVAVKDNLFTTEDYARQFRREAVLLATLRHPNLPRVTDHFVIDGQGQYLVMDYIEGEDLRQRMDRVGVLGDDEVIIIGAAICDALSYLASCNPPVVHRDIKPGNVRITPQGHIYLVDFGLAKDLKTHQTTTTGARAMTPGYSPPEQYGSARTDQRSDIYSLGATLYAALTGMIPEDALSRAVDHVDLTPVRRHNSRVSRRLASVIERSLDIRPDGRYQTAEDFKQALLNSGTPSQRNLDEFVVAPPPGVENKPLPGDHALVPPDVAAKLPRPAGQPAPQLIMQGLLPVEKPALVAKKRRENQLRFWLLSLFVVAITVFAVSFYTINPTISKSALIKIFENFNLIPPFDASNLTPSPAAPGATEPVVAPLAQGSQTPTLTPAPTLTATLPFTLTPTITASPTATATSTPTFTPTPTLTPMPTLMGDSGGQIAFAAARGTRFPQIWLMTTEGTEPRQLTNIPEGACQPAWAPDGRQLVFVSPCERNKESYPGSALFLVPDVDSEKIEVIPLPTTYGGDYDPAWSPDGTKIAFTSERDTASPRIFIMDMADKSVSVVTPLFIRSYHPAWSPDGSQLVYVEEQTLGRIMILDAQGIRTPLLEEPKVASDVHPAWSPDGKSILFTRYPLQGKPPTLIAVNLEKTQEQIEFPLLLGPVPMREAQFSPDGIWLVFESWPTGENHEITIMTSNGASRRDLTSEASFDFDPAWRPRVK